MERLLERNARAQTIAGMRMFRDGFEEDIRVEIA